MPKISQLTTRSGAQLTGSEYVPLQVGTGNARSTITEMTNFISTIIDAGASVTVSQNAPTGAELGDLWFDDTTGALYVWITDGGGAWVQTNGGGQSGGGGASVTTGTTAPTSPADGDLWFDETVAELYVYLASESAWVQTNGGGGSGGIAESPELQFTAINEYNATTNPLSVQNGPYPRWEHGLGQIPVFYTMSLRCKTAEEGWNPGDEFLVGYNGTYGRGEYAVYADSTYVGFIFKSSTNNNPFTIGKKEQSGNNPPNVTANSFLPDPAKWRIVFRASTGSGGGGGSGPRAYVAFDGTAADLTASITNSLNVASITDNGTGNYTITYNSSVLNPVITIGRDDKPDSSPLDPYYKNVTSSKFDILVGWHAYFSSGAKDLMLSAVVH